MKAAITFSLLLLVILIVPTTRDATLGFFGDMLASGQQHSQAAVLGSLGLR